MNIDAGGGFDTLQADFSAFADTIFTVDGAGVITSNHGTYSNFEQFLLTLGNGTNTVTTQGGNDTIYAFNGGINTIGTGAGNDVVLTIDGTSTIDGGAGDDQIFSFGGVDHVDGSADTDTWAGDYSAAAAGLAFSFDGATGAGTLSNGTTLAGIEGGGITTGSGNDSFTIAGDLIFSVDGGAGSNTLNRDDTGLTGVSSGSSFTDSGGGSFNAQIGNGLYSNIEIFNVTLSDDDNTAEVNLAPLTSGATLNLSGGAGFDTLQADFSAFADTTFTVDGAGAITSNHGTYSSFEQFNLALGGGTNTVTTRDGNDTVSAGLGGSNTISTGGGDDQIYSVGGIDHVDGGAGADYWAGDYTGVTADRYRSARRGTDADRHRRQRNAERRSR